MANIKKEEKKNSETEVKKVTAEDIEMAKQEQRMFEPVNVQPEMITTVDKMDLSKQEYGVLVEMGRSVMEVKTFVQWTIGRLGDAVAVRYGDLKQYAKDINYNYDSLKSYVYVYRKFIKDSPDFHPDKYMGSVPWGMLQVVAGSSERLQMPPEQLLNKLLDEGVNTQTAAYAKIKEKETGKILPPKPKAKFEWDEAKEKYRLSFEQKDLDIIDWEAFKEAYLKSILNS